MTHRRIRTHVPRSLLAAALALALTAAASASVAAQSAGTGCPTTWSDDAGEVTLIYCSGDGEFSEIFERTPDGSVRQLTFLGWKASSPQVSPDGTLLVFEASRFSEPHPQIFAIEREGPRARAVAAGSAIILLDGAEPVQLTDVGANTEPSFSPHGDRIDFVSDRLGVSTIWSMDIDGSDQREMSLAEID